MTFEEQCAKRHERFKHFKTPETTPLVELDQEVWPGTYGKFIKKGRLNLHDYDCGVYDLRIKKDGLFVMVMFSTLDDGELVARYIYKSAEEAETVFYTLLNIFEEMEECPSDDALNKLVEPLNIKFEYE